MAKCNFTQSVCLLYLIVSGHVLVDCRRVKSSAEDSQKEGPAGTVAVEASLVQEDAEFAYSSVQKMEQRTGHPWCNWFSRQKTRSYHFDVQLSEKKCKDGQCMAIELVRHKDTPFLDIHAGQSWLIQKDKNGDIEWGLTAPSGTKGKTTAIQLVDVDVIKFLPSNTDYPDKLEIIMGKTKNETDTDGVHNGKVQHDVFDLEGGLFYSEELLDQGFEKMSHEEMQDMEDDAALDSHATRGKNIGKKVGLATGVVSVGGMYIAATMTGVAVQGQALLGASLLGVIGGTVGGALLGGGIGLVIGLGLVIAGSKKVKGFKVISASRKIFEKVRCIDEFKECSDNVLVPTEKECPRDR